MAQLFIFQGKDQEAAKAATLENLSIVEEQLKGKKFFGGDTIGFLDLAFGWLAKYITLLEEASGLKLFDEEKFPLISAWKENFSQVPVIKESWPDNEKLIIKFKAMLEVHLTAAAAK